MKYLASLALSLTVAQVALTKHSGPLGIDVSNYQPNINWNRVVNDNMKFVYILTTEGTCFTSCPFNSQYTDSGKAGLIRGAYHFAHPDVSSGAAQANYFLRHGGGWSADGITLPGALDIEDNPDKTASRCYGLTHSQMVSWIKDFSSVYRSATKRYPVIFTTTDWWAACTGNSGDFAANNPLWISDWRLQLGPLPAGWKHASFLQYSNKSVDYGDADEWLGGSYADLQKMARGP